MTQNCRKMYIIILHFICITVVRAIVSPDVQEWHLVRCLQSISHRYFSTGQMMVISLHECTNHFSRRRYENFTNFGRGYIDVVRYSSEEMYKSESRSVVISNVFTIYVATDWNSNTKPDSYLLLTPSCSNLERDIVQSVNSQLKQLSSYPGWNPRARFVVTVMNISFMYNAEKLLQRILVELWKQKVLNSIVLIPLTNTSKSEDASGTGIMPDGLVMDATALGIYTWFPYRGPNRCSVVDEAVLLDKWLISGEGRFVRNSFLFPQKLIDNFHGCELRVAAKLARLTRAQKTRKSTNVTFYDGLEIRIINLITRTMNLTTIFLPQIRDFLKIQEESGNYVGYTGLLMNDEADIAFGGITRTATPTALMDVTSSYWQIKWEWYVPCPVKFPGWKSIFRIFSLSGWLSILLAGMLANLVIVFLARFGIKEHISFRRFFDAILDVWALILGVSISSFPRTIPLRLFFSAWVCYSLAINTVFQAYLTTFLVEPGFEKSITRVEEVFTSGTRYGFPSIYFDHNFNDKTDPKAVEIIENRIDCPDMVTCVLWTAKYRNISSICNSEFVNHWYYSSDYSNEFRSYQACGLNDMPVLVTNVLMAVQKGSPFLDRMNDIIDQLVESGIIAYLYKYIPVGKKNIETNSETVADGYYVLTMNNMQSAFCLLLFGHILGAISFVMEILYFKMHL